MTTKIYPVKGMTCGGCVRTVETILKNQAGVTEVQVNLEPGEAKISFDEAETNPGKLAETLQKMGYTMAVL